MGMSFLTRGWGISSPLSELVFTGCHGLCMQAKRRGRRQGPQSLPQETLPVLNCRDAHAAALRLGCCTRERGAAGAA